MFLLRVAFDIDAASGHALLADAQINSRLFVHLAALLIVALSQVAVP